jgi:heme exporter protein D
MNWTEFFAMGGYALYVWGSYAAAAVILLLNVFAARHREQSVRRELKNLQPLNQPDSE